MAATLVAGAVILTAPVAAGAATGGAPTPLGEAPPPGSAAGAPAADPTAGIVSLRRATTTPRRAFFFGVRLPRLAYTIASTQPLNDIRVDVVDAGGAVVQTFYREGVVPGAPQSIRWDGTTAAGSPAPDGRYSFRVAPQSGDAPAARPARAGANVSLGFDLYGFQFPILGPHHFDLGGGRFGAARSGHTHQGQDVFAACGTPLVAARGGTVQFAGFQSLAGNYVVIDGLGTADDYVYVHLAEPSPLHAGEEVRTGEPVGIVGDTGDATACHLHFEIWSAPGWYEGGAPFDPLPALKSWDTYS